MNILQVLPAVMWSLVVDLRYFDIEIWSLVYLIWSGYEIAEVFIQVTLSLIKNTSCVIIFVINFVNIASYFVGSHLINRVELSVVISILTTTLSYLMSIVVFISNYFRCIIRLSSIIIALSSLFLLFIIFFTMMSSKD